MFRRQGDRVPDLTDNEAQEERKRPGPMPVSTLEPVTERHVFSELAAIKKELRVSFLPEFDIAGPFTIGGPTATGASAFYRLDSPFTTTCDFCVVTVSNNGTAVNIALTRTPTPNIPSTSPTYDQGGRFEGMFFDFQGFQIVAPPELWYPLPANASLYMAVNGAANSAGYVVIAFRRKRDKQAVYYE